MPHHLRHTLYQMSWKTSITLTDIKKINDAEKLIRCMRYNPYIMEDYFSWELVPIIDMLPSGLLAHVLNQGEQLTDGLDKDVWSDIQHDNTLRAHAGEALLRHMCDPNDLEVAIKTFNASKKLTKSSDIKGDFWSSGSPDMTLFSDYALNFGDGQKRLILFENKTKASLQPYQIIYYMNQLFWASKIFNLFNFTGLVFVFDKTFDKALGSKNHPVLFKSNRADWLEGMRTSKDTYQNKIDAVYNTLNNVGLWDQFKDFCSTLPVSCFSWHTSGEQPGILNTIKAALEGALKDPNSKPFAQRALHNVNDLLQTLTPQSNIQNTYERYIYYEHMIDINNPLETGRQGGALDEMLNGLNETIKKVIGDAGVAAVKKAEQTPVLRFIPVQENKNFKLKPDKRTYALIAAGHKLATLKANSVHPSGWALTIITKDNPLWQMPAFVDALKAIDPNGGGITFDAAKHFAAVVELVRRQLPTLVA